MASNSARALLNLARAERVRRRRTTRATTKLYASCARHSRAIKVLDDAKHAQLSSDTRAERNELNLNSTQRRQYLS